MFSKPNEYIHKQMKIIKLIISIAKKVADLKMKGEPIEG